MTVLSCDLNDSSMKTDRSEWRCEASAPSSSVCMMEFYGFTALHVTFLCRKQFLPTVFDRSVLQPFLLFIFSWVNLMFSLFLSFFFYWTESKKTKRWVSLVVLFSVFSRILMKGHALSFSNKPYCPPPPPPPPFRNVSVIWEWSWVWHEMQIKEMFLLFFVFFF